MFEDKTNVGGAHLEPSYFAIPEDGIVLGEYTQTGLPSFVLRDFRSETDPASTWKSVFLGEPIVTPALLRTLGEMAGNAHLRAIARFKPQSRCAAAKHNASQG